MYMLVWSTCMCFLLNLGVPAWTTVTPSGSTGGAVTEPPTRIQLIRSPESTTVRLDHRLELFCKAEGDGRIKIKWYRNGTKKENELTRKGVNYRILRGGTLRFTKVKVADRGVYRCKAENGFKDDVYSEPAVLTVHAPATIIRRSETGKAKIWAVGSTRHLVCRAAGIPLPRIEWRRDGQRVPVEIENPHEERSDRDTAGAVLSSRLTVIVTHSATYTCTALNSPVGRLASESVSFPVTAVMPPVRMSHKGRRLRWVGTPNSQARGNKFELRPNYFCRASGLTEARQSLWGYIDNVSTIKPDSQQTCRPYAGKFCRDYLGPAPVLTPVTPGRNTTPEDAMIYLDRLLGAHLQELTYLGLFSDHLGQGICLEPARRIICHLAFPTCVLPDPGEMRGTPLPLCRESCQAVSQLFCLRQLVQLQLLKKSGAITGTLGLLGMPDCASLPSKWGHAPGAAPICTESDHHDFAANKVSDSCYVERGRWYNGTVGVTKKGLTCQSWDAAMPHQHNRSAFVYPELQGASNFCRNPGGEEPSPWCYTTDPTVRFDFCDISPCGMLPNGGGDPTNDSGSKTGAEGEDKGKGEAGVGGGGEENGGHSFHILLVIIVVVCALILLIFLAVMLCLCYRRRKYSSAPADDIIDVDVDGLTVNSAYYTPTRLNPKLEAIEFPRNDLVFVERIGQGAFGMVFKARVVCSNGNSRLGGGSGGLLGGKLSSSKQSLGFGDSKSNRHLKSPFFSKGDLRHIEFHDPLGKITCDSKLLSGEHTGSDHQIWSKDENEVEGGGGEENGQIVAVKMLKEDASESVQADFQREASLMVEFEHENIVRLLGVCTMGRPMCLLFEYMSHGDLNDYLQLCSPDRCLMRPLPTATTVMVAPNTEVSPLPSSISVKTPRGDSRLKLDTADHLHISRQVCNGMVYLSDRGYVHRDLATRNCLVTDGLTVKISDFGLARSVHSMDYYRGSDRDAVPIRWMPPEAILYNKFSSQSDVWSFGVLLWEVFSYAFQPYYGMTHEQVIAALRAGRTLGPPEDAPPAVYSLMKSCWRTKPSSRPSFSSLHKCLVSMHEEACRAKTGMGNVRL